MAYIATELPANFSDYVGENAGVLLSTFDTSAWSVTRSNIIGATTGGIAFADVPEYSDWGEDIDNCPKNTKELKHLSSREVTISGTFVAADTSAFTKLAGAADYSSAGKTITPRDQLADDDFNDIWFVFDYGDGNAVAIEVKDVLSTGGLSIQTADKAKAQYAFTFTAHYSIDNPATVPYKVYFKS